MAPSAADQMNEHMVDRLIAEGALWSRGLIAAFRATPRHRFLDRVFQFHRKQNRWREITAVEPGPEPLRLIYSDRALITRLTTGPGFPVPISSSSQPSLMAQMLEDLKPEPGLSVLEIGTGTGYNAALLAHVVGPGRVVSVDVDRQVLAEARAHLRAVADRGIELQHADGRYGYALGAPYDRLMVTAATADVEPAWLDQLVDRGLLLAPVVFAPGLAFVARGTVTEGVFHGRLTRAAYFMPLRAEGEAGPSELAVPPPGGEPHEVAAPWAGWFDRKRPRGSWLGFSQALAFYGLLRGLNVHYRMMEPGRPAYGVSQGGALCWYGHQAWQANGDSGRELGWALWRAFLEAGGPWPTEFRFRASRDGGVLSGRRESYVRRGPGWQQLWELMEPRDRPAWLSTEP